MTALFCPNCGAHLKEGQHFCMRCGCDIREWADVLDTPDALGKESEEQAAHAQDDRLATVPQTKGDDSPFERDANTAGEDSASAVSEDEEARHAAPEEDVAKDDEEIAESEEGDAEPADPAQESAGARHAAPEDKDENAAKDADTAKVSEGPTDPAEGDAEATDPAKDTHVEGARHTAPEDAAKGADPTGDSEGNDEEATDPTKDMHVEGARHAAPEEGTEKDTDPAEDNEEPLRPAKDAQAEIPAHEREEEGTSTDSDPESTSTLPVITHDPAAISLLPVSRHHPRLYKEESKAGHRHVLIFAFLTLAIVVAGLALGISSCRSKDFADPQAERVVPGGYHEDNDDASDGSGQSPLAAEKAAKDRERDRQAVKELYDELAALDEQVSACEAAYDEDYVADRDTRSGDSETVTQLTATIQKAQQQAKRTNIESRSDYYNQYQLELTCYQYLIDRMDLVAQMWALNLRYNYPQKYVEKLREIRIKAIREGETDVAPKVDYDRAYSEISL